MLFIIPASLYYVVLIGDKKLEQTLNKPVLLPVLLFMALITTLSDTDVCCDRQLIFNLCCSRILGICFDRSNIEKPPTEINHRFESWPSQLYVPSALKGKKSKTKHDKLVKPYLEMGSQRWGVGGLTLAKNICQLIK